MGAIKKHIYKEGKELGVKESDQILIFVKKQQLAEDEFLFESLIAQV